MTTVGRQGSEEGEAGVTLGRGKGLPVEGGRLGAGEPGRACAGRREAFQPGEVEAEGETTTCLSGWQGPRERPRNLAEGSSILGEDQQGHRTQRLTGAREREVGRLSSRSY